MNSQPLQPSILPSRSLTERVVSGVGKALRAAGILRVHWRDSRARRREARAVDACSASAVESRCKTPGVAHRNQSHRTIEESDVPDRSCSFDANRRARCAYPLGMAMVGGKVRAPATQQSRTLFRRFG